MDESEAILRHIRGQSITHENPFSSIEVPSSPDSLTNAEYKKWVMTFAFPTYARDLEDLLAPKLKRSFVKITPELITRLLTYPDWYSHSAGAFLATLKRVTTLEEHLGRLLLRSDYCFVGKTYCTALVEFNSPSSIEYLSKYLNFYLTRPDLEFNQGDAMGALALLDEKNGTSNIDAFRSKWNEFASVRTWSRSLERNIASISAEVVAIRKIRDAVKCTK